MGGCVSLGDVCLAPCSCLIFPPGWSTSVCCCIGVPPWGWCPWLCKPCCNAGRYTRLRSDKFLVWIPFCGKCHCGALHGCGCSLAVPAVSRPPRRQLGHAPAGYTILFAHGNAQDLEWMRTEVLGYLSRRLRTPVNLVAFEYPGYSFSNLPTGEALINAAAEAAYTQVCQAVPEDRVVLYGISLGTGVMCRLAASHSPAGLILQSPYTSLASTAVPTSCARLLPCCDMFESYGCAPLVKCPVQIIHGADDSIIPPRCSRELQKLFPNARPAVFVDGAGHNNLLWALQDNPAGDRWVGIIESFLASLGSAPAPSLVSFPPRRLSALGAAAADASRVRDDGREPSGADASAPDGGEMLGTAQGFETPSGSGSGSRSPFQTPAGERDGAGVT